MPVFSRKLCCAPHTGPQVTAPGARGDSEQALRHGSSGIAASPSPLPAGQRRPAAPAPRSPRPAAPPGAARARRLPPGLSPLRCEGTRSPAHTARAPRAPGGPPAPHSPPRSTNRSVCLSELKSPKATRVPRASGPKS